MKIVKPQIQKIHIAKKELNLTDSEYKDLLSNFDVSSSKDLDYKQAEELLTIFEKLGWTKKQSNKKSLKEKYEDLNPRGFGFASPGQLRKIEALYRDLNGSESNEGLNKLIKRIVKIDHISWLKKKDVPKILKCLENMKQSKHKKAS